MRKYRIKEEWEYPFAFDVEMKTIFGWILVKRFIGDNKDREYTRLCAWGLLDKLNEEI